MKKKSHKLIKRIVTIIIGIILLFFVSLVIYSSNYYHATESDIESIKASTGYSVKKNLTTLTPDEPSDIGIIFYPGAKVEATAYLPLLDDLRNEGITCVLVKMPFNLAIFDSNAANAVYTDYPDINHWYIAGHSLGGAMASSYYSKNQSKLDGIILLGAYRYGDIPLSHTLTIYGTNDKVLNRSKIDYTENVETIEGGNHGQFGNYGEQKGDGKATISRDEQQAQTVKDILAFINKTS